MIGTVVQPLWWNCYENRAGTVALTDHSSRTANCGWERASFTGPLRNRPAAKWLGTLEIFFHHALTPVPGILFTVNHRKDGKAVKTWHLINQLMTFLLSASVSEIYIYTFIKCYHLIIMKPVHSLVVMLRHTLLVIMCCGVVVALRSVVEMARCVMGRRYLRCWAWMGVGVCFGKACTERVKCGFLLCERLTAQLLQRMQ